MNRRRLGAYLQSIRQDTSHPVNFPSERCLSETSAGANSMSPDFKRALLQKLDNLPAGSRVLEVGIGKGFLLRELREKYPNLKFFATNYFASSNPSTEKRVVNADASKLPFKQSSFDLVFSQFCFRYVPDKVGFLHETHRILRNGASALIYPFRVRPTASQDFKIHTPSGNVSPYAVLTNDPQFNIMDIGDSDLLTLTKNRDRLRLPLRFSLTHSKPHEFRLMGFESVYHLIDEK